MKKAMDLSLNYIIIAAILLVVLVVVIVMFSNQFGRGAEQINENIGGLDDKDLDNVINMFDKCPCVPGETEFEGCKDIEKLTKAKEKPEEEDRTCLKENTKNDK